MYSEVDSRWHDQGRETNTEDTRINEVAGWCLNVFPWRDHRYQAFAEDVERWILELPQMMVLMF